MRKNCRNHYREKDPRPHWFTPRLYKRKKDGRLGVAHPIFQSSNLPIFQSSNLPIFQSSNLPIFQSSNLPIFQSYSWFLGFLPAGNQRLIIPFAAQEHRQMAGLELDNVAEFLLLALESLGLLKACQYTVGKCASSVSA